MVFRSPRKIFLVITPRRVSVNDAVLFYILDNFNTSILRIGQRGKFRKADLPRYPLTYISLLSYSFALSCDECQNLFCKGNHHAARKGQKAVRPLGRVVGFQRQAHLHDAEAEHNHPDSLNQTEDKV